MHNDWRGETNEILFDRDVRDLASSRDIPRLFKKTRIVLIETEKQEEGIVCYEGGSVLELLRTIRQVLGESKEAVQEKETPADTARAFVMEVAHGAHKTQGEVFVAKTLSQNVIAPALVRLKTALAKAGFVTVDGSWEIEVAVVAKSNPVLIRVRHTRGEVDHKSGLEILWRLQVWSAKDKPQSLRTLEVKYGSLDAKKKVLLDATLKEALADYENHGAGVGLPPVQEYFQPSYFSW